MTEITSKLSTALADRYKIERHLGEGGMATVYLAEDLKHKRKVAVKVLRPELAAVLGAERFVQEITTTANLQHPHILPLFDSGEADSFLYYVMPYIDGETLRDKLNRETQLGIEEAVQITRDVADALDYAHRHNVIHRDIKPENILLHEGRPMVADFGIALAVSAAAGGRMTETGLSLGTPHYMSPEQATAEKDLTSRSDIYSLGSVLYEMLTGSPPHVGSTAQQIIMKIVTDEARSVTELRKSIPPHVAAATAKALEKLPADRFGSAEAFADALGDTTFTVPASSGTKSTVGAVASAVRQRPSVVLGVFALAAVGLALFGWLRPVPRDVLRVGVVFGEEERVFSTQNRQFALAPDGSRIVYPGRGTSETAIQQLWVRDLNSPASRPLPGTEGGVAPFFSPDGEYVAFVASRQLRVVPVAGGSIQTLITDSVMPWGGDWSVDDWLYVTRNRRLTRVPSTGGVVEIVSIPDTSRGESFHEYPDAHPNGVHVLMQLWIRSVNETEIGVLSLETGEVSSLGRAVTGRFLPNGDIAYVTNTGDLMVATYDERAMAFAAPGTVLQRDVRIDNFAGAALFDVSNTGHLMYAPGSEQETGRVVWVDRAGDATPIDPEWGGWFFQPSLSPDGSRLAVFVLNAGGDALWTKDVSGGLPSQLTFGRGPFTSPAWGPDGRKVAFISQESWPSTMWQRNADGSGQAERFSVPPAKGTRSLIWSSDGWLVYNVERAVGEVDIRAWHPDSGTTERVVVEGGGVLWAPTVSPDGRWVAYVLREEFGKDEVFVTQFHDAGGDTWRVSVDGGSEPVWAHSGRELFYRTPGGELVSRRVDLSDVVRLGDVQPLFDASSFQSDPTSREYDVAPDDQRFVMIQRGVSTSTLMMVVNWLEELKALGR